MKLYSINCARNKFAAVFTEHFVANCVMCTIDSELEVSMFRKFWSVLVVLMACLSGVFAQENEPIPLVQGNNEFALTLYQQLAAQEGNLFVSPYSISQAFALAYAGARGATAQEIAAVMGWQDIPTSDFAATYERLNADLLARGNPARSDFNPEPSQLQLANSFWGDESYAFAPEFTSLLDAAYRAPLQVLDFVNQPEPARLTINEWVAQNTAERIQDILPQGTITPETRLVLANAIYFKDAWLNPFWEGNTAVGDFTLLDGTTVQVPLMNGGGNLPYALGRNFEAVELPYTNPDLAMLIIAPSVGDYANWESSFDPQFLDEVLANLQYRPVNLVMPKFKMEYELNLGETLVNMGMNAAFTDTADFSGMSAAGKRDLFISTALHKAFIAVDEKGTEAAAATVLVIATSSAPTDPVTLTLNRPFFYIIRDRATNSILFIGRMIDPSAAQE
jgi:serpin B